MTDRDRVAYDRSSFHERREFEALGAHEVVEPTATALHVACGRERGDCRVE